MSGNAIADARLFNRSLMSSGALGRPSLPPEPPMRGLSSYNGVRVGSMLSFGGNGSPVTRVFPYRMSAHSNGGSNPDCNVVSSKLQV